MAAYGTSVLSSGELMVQKRGGVRIDALYGSSVRPPETLEVGGAWRSSRKGNQERRGRYLVKEGKEGVFLLRKRAGVKPLLAKISLFRHS